MVPITLGNTEIRRSEEGLVSLTDLHQAAAAQRLTEGKQSPSEWARRGGEQFIDFVATNLNAAKSRIYKSTRGKGGGTFAHWQIALAYAKYLSPELHMQVNEVYARAKSGDVTLADEIADKATYDQQVWLAKRLQGKIARSQLTSTLSQHGVSGKGYADCTNAIYKPILGGKKSEVCAANGIPNKKSISMRDLMTVEQLMATGMAELVAKKQIEKFNVHGNILCAAECDRAARKVVSLLQ